MRVALLLVLLLPVLSAQQVFPAQSPEAKAIAPFFTEPLPANETRIRCQAQGFPPRLSFGFQYWSGFDLAIRATELVESPKEKPLTVAVEFTNAEGQKSYFYQRSILPQNIPAEFWTRSKVELNLGGGYLVGAGKYQARLLLMDAAGRACRDQWKFEAKPAKVPSPIPPGEVRMNDFVWKGIPPKATDDRVTVFLHAAPLYSRRNMTRLRSWDKAVLLGSLTSLLNVSRFARARVIVFNLDARKVLYTTDNFSRMDFRRLSRALDDFNMGTVSIDTLTGKGEASFLEEVLRYETEVPQTRERGQAVVFLGPSWRWGSRLTPLLRELRGQLPDTVYLSLGSVFSNTEDILHDFVKAGKGKVIDVFDPLDLAKAIRQLDERLGRSNGSSR